MRVHKCIKSSWRGSVDICGVQITFAVSAIGIGLGPRSEVQQVLIDHNQADSLTILRAVRSSIARACSLGRHGSENAFCTVHSSSKDFVHPTAL